MQLIPTTAKIYQFPVGGRTNSDATKTEAHVQQDAQKADAPAIVYGNWYHDAAIEDARLPGKH